MAATAVAPVMTGTGEPEFTRIPVESLHESPKNPRTHYDETALAQLAENLITVGQITPIIVRERQKGGWEILAGHRRCRAARRAGLQWLDAIVRDVDDRTAVEILNLENLQRDDLNPIEEARGFRVLMEDAGYDIKRLAARMNLAERTVYDRVALLRVIPEAQELIASGVLSPAHGALLSRLTTDDQRRALSANGALMLRENVSPSHFPELEVDVLDDELNLKDARKPATVREFKQWIAENVRFRPEQLTQTDLAMDLPATVELLDRAEDRKLKVVKITPSYRVPDAARDKERTYGRASWKQADGEPERYDRYGMHDPKAKPTKTCEHAVVGLVVAGPGRGEAFMVCVAKDRCQVHWAKEIKEKAQKAQSAGGKGGAGKAESWEEQDRRRRERYEAEQQKRRALAEVHTAGHMAAMRELLDKVTPGDFAPHIRDVMAAMLLCSNRYGLEEECKAFFPELKPQRTLAKNIVAVRALPSLDRFRLLVFLALGDQITVDQWNKPDPDYAEALKQLGVDVPKHLKAAEQEAKAKEQAARAELKPKKKAATKKSTKRRAGDLARAKKAKAAAANVWVEDNDEEIF